MSDLLQKKLTPLEGLVVLQPRVFEDDRGHLFESFNERSFHEVELPVRFFQDVHSRSRRNVLRGLHMQSAKPLAKLVRVSSGEVFDVSVDLRRGSPTFGKTFSILLSGENRTMVFVPSGFFHGFCVLSEWADLLYKFTAPWEPVLQRGIRWNDTELGISWPLSDHPVLSGKDDALPFLENFPEVELFDAGSPPW